MVVPTALCASLVVTTRVLPHYLYFVALYWTMTTWVFNLAVFRSRFLRYFLTGYLLVWDQKAYWATVVAVNIFASAPILGPYIGDILRAGPEFGPATLSRFYSIHMLVIPLGIATFIGLHLYFIIRLGISEPPWSKRRLKIERDEEDARREAARERTKALPGSVNYPASWPVEAKETSR